jgi:transcriptional regulator with XRE-family HTH domain
MMGVAVPQSPDTQSQTAFARAVCRAIRDSRRRQHLTQAEVAQRTGGLLSKAALANYETGHRGLRVEVLWVIAGALGVDIKTLMDDAARRVGPVRTASAGEWVTVKVDDVMASTDPRLAVVKRWVELRATGPNTEMVLDDGVIVALAALMNTTVDECRMILMSTIGQAHPA